jgi:hypothetical protein
MSAIYIVNTLACLLFQIIKKTFVLHTLNLCYIFQCLAILNTQYEANITDVKKATIKCGFLFAKLNYFLAGASAAGAGVAFLSAAGAALLSAGFTAALGSAAGLSAAIAVNGINAVITNANILFIYYP